MPDAPVVLHLDLDAFFAAVEQLHKPSLRGRPVVVGGTGPRAVVSTASYEARAYGIGSAMAVAHARRLCPNAAYLRPRIGAYRQVSAQVMELLRELSPVLEQVSVDEAYLDLTGTVTAPGDAAPLAAALRAGVLAATGLTASVGVATSKLVAKVASELAKPDGLRVVPAGEEAAVLAPLPVRRLPWIGPATEERLVRHGITTVGRLAAADATDLVAWLGRAHGTALHRYARGVDDREVVTGREAKSISAETTFARDLTDRDELDARLRGTVQRVVERLVADGGFARTVTVKVRRPDFSTLTRSATLPQATDEVTVVLERARALLAGIDTSGGVRLLGAGVSGLTDHAQQDLLAGLDTGLPGEDDDPAAGGPAAAGTDAAPPGGDDDHPPSGPGWLRWDAATGRGWAPGQDVVHATRGPGWVQGSGLGRVTVRFEGPHTPPGPIATLAVDDPELEPADPPTW